MLRHLILCCLVVNSVAYFRFWYHQSCDAHTSPVLEYDNSGKLVSNYYGQTHLSITGQGAQVGQGTIGSPTNHNAQFSCNNNHLDLFWYLGPDEYLETTFTLQEFPHATCTNITSPYSIVLSGGVLRNKEIGAIMCTGGNIKLINNCFENELVMEVDEGQVINNVGNYTRFQFLPNKYIEKNGWSVKGVLPLGQTGVINQYLRVLPTGVSGGFNGIAIFDDGGYNPFGGAHTVILFQWFAAKGSTSHPSAAKCQLAPYYPDHYYLRTYSLVHHNGYTMEATQFNTQKWVKPKH